MPEQYEPCDTCGGSGVTGEIQCTTCMGAGRLPVRSTCSECGGYGKLLDGDKFIPCPTCHTAGVIPYESTTAFLFEIVVDILEKWKDINEKVNEIKTVVDEIKATQP